MDRAIRLKNGMQIKDEPSSVRMSGW